MALSDQDRREITEVVEEAIREAFRGDPELGQHGMVHRMEKSEALDAEHAVRLAKLESRWIWLTAFMVGSGLGGGLAGSAITRALERGSP